MERSENLKQNYKAITDKIAKLPESIQATLFMFLIYHRNMVGNFWVAYSEYYQEINDGIWGNYDPQSFRYGYNFDKGCSEISILINGKLACFQIYSPQSQNIEEWGYKIKFVFDDKDIFAVEEIKDDQPMVMLMQYNNSEEE